MASFLSALSLVVLVFANSCFALPVTNEDSSPISLLNENLTTDRSLNARLTSNDGTTELSTLLSQRSSDEHMGFEESTMVGNLPEENASHVTRGFEEFSTSEPSMLTTEESTANKHDSNETLHITVRPLELTTERFAQDKRQFSVLSLRTSRTPVLTTERFVRNEDDSLPITVGSETLTTEKSVETKRGFSDLLYGIVQPLLLTTERAVNNESSAVESSGITVESSVLTTEESAKSKREFSALLYDIVEPLLLTTDGAMNTESNADTITISKVEGITQVGQIQKRNFENGTEGEMVDESATDELSTSTRKYIGNDKDSSKQIEQSRKSPKAQRKVKMISTSTISRDYHVESEETSKDSTVPTAVFDQDASKKISNVPSDFLILDETVEIVVTDHPERLSSKTTMKNTKEAKPLNQGSTILLFLLAALLLCACLMASTLAFIKNRQTLKRKSRITEMEAHLDDELYPHPFIFPYHYGK